MCAAASAGSGNTVVSLETSEAIKCSSKDSMTYGAQAVVATGKGTLFLEGEHKGMTLGVALF